MIIFFCTMVLLVVLFAYGIGYDRGSNDGNQWLYRKLHNGKVRCPVCDGKRFNRKMVSTLGEGPREYMHVPIRCDFCDATGSVPILNAPPTGWKVS